MVSSDDRLTLGEAAALFLEQLPADKRGNSQAEVNKFARWYGPERPVARITAPEVAGYAEQMSLSDKDSAKKLELVRAFLAYAKKAGWSNTNLGVHLKAKKAKAGPVSARRVQHGPVSLTRQRYGEMRVELDTLKKRSLELVGEIQRAAADKDFRENAPLHAAREERGHVEGRIKEIEEIFKVVTIIDENREATHKTGVGDSVVLCDLSSGAEVCYMIVDPREVDASRGKISMVSPLGKAIVGRREGDEFEITAPAGKRRYQIKRIER
jgi:transcription elongation factor GreA